MDGDLSENGSDVEDNFGDVSEEEEEPPIFHGGTKNKESDNLDIDALNAPSIDPNEWKIELERVAPKLKSFQQRLTTEWRNHVVQITENSTNIEKVSTSTRSELVGATRNVSDEISRISSREAYLNSQFPSLTLLYKEVKVQLDDLARKSTASGEIIAKLNGELSEITDKIDELKDLFESKDSGMNDTSPLVKIKSALQQIKSEISTFDLRIGVVSHSLLAAKHLALKQSRAQETKNKRLKGKSKNESSTFADYD
jgi:estrogen-related receptor beta like 1